MKGRESGMPDEQWWASFFDVEAALDLLCGGMPQAGDMVEFGCGYGTFTIPTGRRTRGVVTAMDIEAEMVAVVSRKAVEAGLSNIRVVQRDFLSAGTGLPAATQSHAMIFNLLHIESPLALLQEAYRSLRDGGELSVMHWRSDIPTPRGPPLDIRPSVEQCEAWIGAAGFQAVRRVNLEACCRYHFGLVARR